jgi:hypothetical protein
MIFHPKAGLWVKTLVLIILGIASSRSTAVNGQENGSFKRFRRGEKMLYSIEYAGINAGYSFLRVDSELTYVGERTAYHLVNETWSNPFFSKFYRVHDRVEAFTDFEYLYSLRFQKNLREGSYKHQESVDFDQANNKVTYSTGQVVETTPEARDILTSLFWARLFPLEVGKSIYIDNHTDKKNYPLEVKVYRKEKLKTAIGEVECLVVEPVLRYPGLFENKGRLWVWLTNDSRRIPVLMKSKIIIGSINAVLKEYNPGMD